MANSSALRLWTSLDQANRKLERLLTSLAGYEGLAAYDEALKAASEERVQVPRPEEGGWRAWAAGLFGVSVGRWLVCNLLLPNPL